jgi:hypothetical protein
MLSVPDMGEIVSVGPGAAFDVRWVGALGAIIPFQE